MKLINQYVDMKSFQDLKEEIIDRKLCSACGTCSSFCENIDLVEGVPTLIKDCAITKGALKCGVCYDQCPTRDAVKGERFLTLANVDELLGNYLEIVALRSKDSEVIGKAQDGGAVSEILRYALSYGIIESAIISTRDENWRPSPLLVKKAKDVLIGSGTKYFFSSNVSILCDAICSGIRKIAIVGTPCQIKGVRLTQSYLLDGIEKVDFLTIGLFCMENFRYESLTQFLKPFLVEKGLTIADIKRTDIRKGIFTLRNPKEDIKIEVSKLEPIVPESCKICNDFAAELADISVGSIGSPDGWSTVITRSNKGYELVKAMINRRILDSGVVKLDSIKKIAKEKKEKAAKWAK